MAVVVVLAGPNGAGKSTVAPALIHQLLKIEDLVNADVLARGLSAFNPWRVRERARSVQDDWLKDLISGGGDFAFETTLASVRWSDWIESARQAGFSVHLIYVWLSTPQLCVHRVQTRVDAGGHSVPEDVIRGRYDASLRNLVSLYIPAVDGWQVFDNSGPEPLLVAKGDRVEIEIEDGARWAQITEAGSGN